MRRLLAVAAVLIIYNLFFYSHPFPDPGTLGSLAFISTYLGFIWVSLWPQPHHLHQPRYRLALTTTFLTLALTLISLFRASYFDRGLLFLTTLGLSGLTTYLLALTHSSFGALSEIILSPNSLLSNWFVSLGRLIRTGHTAIINHSLPKLKSRLPSSSSTTHLIRGLIFTLPIALIVTILLSAADPVFNHFTQQLWSYIKDLHFLDIFLHLNQRLTTSLTLTLISLPLAYLTIARRFISPFNQPRYQNLKTEAQIVVITLAVILGLFLVVQFRYLFASVPETSLSQYGVATYSEYVRRGFIELVLVSLIVYSVSSASYLVNRHASTPRLKATNLALLTEALVFIFSIFRRLYLYAFYHGLTRVRLYGLFFLFIVIGLTTTLALRQLTKSKRPWYLTEATIVLATLVIAATINVDRLIATHFPPTVNHEIDYLYISRLSLDATTGWVQAYHWSQTTATQLAADPNPTFTTDQYRHYTYARNAVNYLIHQYTQASSLTADTATYHLLDPNSTRQPHTTWLNLNLAERQAYQHLRTTIDPSELASLAGQLDGLQTRVTTTSAPLDRSTNSPLTQ